MNFEYQDLQDLLNDLGWDVIDRYILSTDHTFLRASGSGLEDCKDSYAFIAFLIAVGVYEDFVNGYVTSPDQKSLMREYTVDIVLQRSRFKIMFKDPHVKNYGT